MNLKKLVRAGTPAFFLFGSFLAIPGCGDDSGDGPSPEEACEEAMSIICRKVFNCFSDVELDALATIIGNSASDCTTKLGAQNCNEDAVRCDTGQKYNAKRAEECVDGYRDFSCDDVTGNFEGTTPDPAACELICEQE